MIENNKEPETQLENLKPKTSKVPKEVWPLLAVFISVLIILSLISYNTKDPSFLNKIKVSETEDMQNHIGLIGAYLSAALISLLGLWALYPIPVLLVYAYKSLKNSLRFDWLFMLAGSALLLFAGCAIFSIILPTTNFIWAEHSGGGILGSFLANGIINLLGLVGSLLILPSLALFGFLMLLDISFQDIKKLFRKNKVLPKDFLTEDFLSEDFSTEDNKAISKEKIIEKPKTIKSLINKNLETKIVANNKVEEKKNIKETSPNNTATKNKQDKNYTLPPLDFLTKNEKADTGISNEQLLENAKILEEKLLDFGIEGHVSEVSSGPVITMYEYKPAPGIKISRIANLADDLTMAIKAIAIRIVAPIPGKAAIGFEIPNPKRNLVSFHEVAVSEKFQSQSSPLTIILGSNITGEPVVADLSKMPHLLIAGATGSGKSVGLGTMIMSILYKAHPNEVKFLMIDPKSVELALYQDLPHLIYPVISDPTEATLALKWAVSEMDERYKLLAKKSVRNISSYNEKIKAEKIKRNKAEDDPDYQQLPYLVIVIDELADLMMVASKEVELYITRLAQKARAAGIHLILATQRPSVDILTGVIKANLPTRISFQVSSKFDSRTILDQIGAEKLLGAGDMLFMPPGVAKVKRLHGAFVSDQEIKKVTQYIRQWGEPTYLDDLMPIGGDNLSYDGEEKDDKYEEAINLVISTERASISHVQRHLRIGYNRAARIIEDMERDGIVGPADGAKARTIYGKAD